MEHRSTFAFATRRLRLATLRAMATFTGTVRKNDLEGGFFELQTDDGAYRLEGANEGDLQPGRRVVVHGSLEDGGFGIHMSGPAIKVRRIESA